MKPFHLGVAIFSTALLINVPAAAQTAPAPRPYAGQFSNRILDDVVRMTHAGISDDSIVAYVRARMPRLAQDLHPQDLDALQQAGVSENVVRFIADAMGYNGAGGTRGVQADVQAGYGDTVPVDPGAYGYGGYPAYGYSGYPAYGYAYGYPGYYAYGYPYAYWGYPYYGYAYWPWWGWGWHGGHGHVAHFSGGHFHGHIGHGGGGHGHGGGGPGHGGGHGGGHR